MQHTAWEVYMHSIIGTLAMTSSAYLRHDQYSDFGVYLSLNFGTQLTRVT
jgi:hypothetical protein